MIVVDKKDNSSLTSTSVRNRGGRNIMVFCGSDDAEVQKLPSGIPNVVVARKGTFSSSPMSPLFSAHDYLGDGGAREENDESSTQSWSDSNCSNKGTLGLALIALLVIWVFAFYLSWYQLLWLVPAVLVFVIAQMCPNQ